MEKAMEKVTRKKVYERAQYRVIKSDAGVSLLITMSHDQCCKSDSSSQWEVAKLRLSPHPHPLTDSHQILHTWLRPPYLPTSQRSAG